MPTPLVGMLLFIASEVMFFGGLFAAYFNARAAFVGEWGPVPPAEPLEILPIALPITIILLDLAASRCSSACGPSGAATSARCASGRW